MKTPPDALGGLTGGGAVAASNAEPRLKSHFLGVPQILNPGKGVQVGLEMGQCYRMKTGSGGNELNSEKFSTDAYLVLHVSLIVNCAPVSS